MNVTILEFPVELGTFTSTVLVPDGTVNVIVVGVNVAPLSAVIGRLPKFIEETPLNEPVRVTSAPTAAVKGFGLVEVIIGIKLIGNAADDWAPTVATTSIDPDWEFASVTLADVELAAGERSTGALTPLNLKVALVKLVPTISKVFWFVFATVVTMVITGVIVRKVKLTVLEVPLVPVAESVTVPVELVVLKTSLVAVLVVKEEIVVVPISTELTVDRFKPLTVTVILLVPEMGVLEVEEIKGGGLVKEKAVEVMLEEFVTEMLTGPAWGVVTKESAEPVPKVVGVTVVVPNMTDVIFDKLGPDNVTVNWVLVVGEYVAEVTPEIVGVMVG